MKSESSWAAQEAKGTGKRDKTWSKTKENASGKFTNAVASVGSVFSKVFCKRLSSRLAIVEHTTRQ